MAVVEVLRSAQEAAPRFGVLQLKAIRKNLGWYRAGGFDPTTKLTASTFVRAMLTPDGPATVRVEWGDPSRDLVIDAWGPGADWAATAAPRMTAVDKVVEPPPFHDPMVAEAARRHPHVAAGASGDLYHALLPTIIGQRITLGEAIRQWAMLVRRLGEPAPGPFPGLRLPPSPERLSRMPTWWFHPIGIEVKRARTLVAVARAAHHLREWSGLAPADAAAKLMLISGVGPWTIGMVLGPACGDEDAVPVGDYHIPRMVTWNLAGEPRGDDARMLELLEPYRPQRGRVIRLLGLVGRRPPAFGPKRRILPMYRW
jgi:3-methyladenine DNA glycosylase/8-oxoguanine DNA glycosylase